MNFDMSNELKDQSSLSEQDDNIVDISPSIVLDNDESTLSYSAEKMANSVVEQFFGEIQTNDDDTKFAKCLLCRTIVKQSSTSTYNYGRHVQRKHAKEMDKWKGELETKKSNVEKKQPTIRQSFGQPGTFYLNDMS